MEPKFPCSFCSFKSDSELKYKNHVLAKHMLNNVKKVMKNPTSSDIISPPPVRTYYPQDLKRDDIFVCSYCDFKDTLNSQVMQHIHAKHPGHPVLVSLQPTTPLSNEKKPKEECLPLQQKQVSLQALKVKREFTDVKQKPDKSNQAELKQLKKRLKAESKKRKKYKRTSAEVSSEDKQLAEKAIEDLQALRSRLSVRQFSASTDDLTCRLCDPAKTFDSYIGLLYHYKSHAGHKPFKCEKCQATFTRQHGLNYHLMTHENLSRFTCPQPNCDRKFRHPTHFREHLKSKHNEVLKKENMTLKQREKAEKAEIKQRKRKGKTLAEVSSGDKQLAEKAIEDLQARGYSTKDLTCRLCDPAKTFTAYSTLLTHLRSHAGQRNFKCDKCQATFTRRHSLAYHLMTHQNISRFACPHCNRKFNHPSHYKNHVIMHGDVAKFDCQFCDSVFLLPKDYQKHLKSQHNKDIDKFDIMGNEKLLQIDKIFADEILAKDNQKLGGKGTKKMKSYLDEDEELGLEVSLQTEPGTGPGQTEVDILKEFGIQEENDEGQTLAQVLGSSEGIETGAVVYLTPKHPDYMKLQNYINCQQENSCKP